MRLGARGVPTSWFLGRCRKFWPKTTETACLATETPQPYFCNHKDKYYSFPTCNIPPASWSLLRAASFDIYSSNMVGSSSSSPLSCFAVFFPHVTQREIDSSLSKDQTRGGREGGREGRCVVRHLALLEGSEEGRREGGG
jgi:hypothetical protein